jgi:hypothetical protein
VTSVRPLVTFVSVDQPFTVAVEITNHGKSAANGIPVKLATDANPPLADTVIDRLESGASRVVNLTARFSTSGPHSITARLAADALPFDDSRTFALRVLPQLRTLVVEGEVPAEKPFGDSYFLTRALVPVPAEAAGSHFIKIVPSTPAGLDGSDIGENPLIFLCNVSRVSASAAGNLRRHVNAGGTLVIFPGPATDLDFLNSDPDFSALMPARLEPAVEKSLAWQRGDYPHPLTAIWNTPSSGNLGSVTVTKYFPLRMEQADGSSVVVSYANGEPAIATRTVGRGRVFLFSSPATPGWTNLPLHSGFVPLLLRLAVQSGGEIGEGLNLAPNQVFTAPLDAGAIDAPVSVIHPGDSTRHPAGLVEASGSGSVLRHHETSRAGAYRLYLGEEKEPRALFAVQPNAAESDDTRISADDLASLTTARRTAPAAATASAEPSGAARVPGPELWATFALIALIVVLVETSMAHFFSRTPA